jgi:hypothetical protein
VSLDLFALTRREFQTSPQAKTGSPNRYSAAVRRTLKRATRHRGVNIGYSKADDPARVAVLEQLRAARMARAATA